MTHARPRAPRTRTLGAVVLAALLASPGCSAEAEADRLGPTLMQMARHLGSDVVRTLVRGYVPGRSGDIALVPEPWNVLGQWRQGREGVRDPRSTHATPWSYHQRVPISLYGPGYIRPDTRIDRPVDVADLSATLAELLEFEFDAPAGSLLREALVPASRRPEPPRAIVVVVFDGGGWNVLEQWPDAWPAQRRAMRAGTTYTNAISGSAPTVTAPVHATIGTGAFPRLHGIPENACRLPDGTIGEVMFERADLRLLSAETLADAWDRFTANRAWVGMAGYESWHLGMMGHGAAIEGGDRDESVLWDTKANEFWTNTDAYELPAYLPPRSALDARVAEIDASDGARDGRWGGNLLDPELYQFPGNPAFASYSGEAMLKMARREPIGQDAVTDLAFFEFKTGDIAGHVWGMQSRQFRTVWRTQDRVFGELVRVLDRRIGRGRYVLAITADHGQTPMAENYGGLRIDRFQMAADVDAAFGVVETVQPSDLYVDPDAFEDSGISLEEIARFIGDYRYREGMPAGFDEDRLPSELLDRRVFAAALPGPFLGSLTNAEINALGPGRYAEGDLTSAPGGLPL